MININDKIIKCRVKNRLIYYCLKCKKKHNKPDSNIYKKHINYMQITEEDIINIIEHFNL